MISSRPRESTILLSAQIVLSSCQYQLLPYFRINDVSLRLSNNHILLRIHKQISIFLVNKIDIHRYIYIYIDLYLLLVHAWSSIYYKFYSIPLPSQVGAANRFPLWIIEKRPFPVIKWTCRWTLEMEMKASRVPADSAIFSKISFLDTSRSNNSCLVHIRRKDVPIIRIIFHWWWDTIRTTDLGTIVSLLMVSLLFDSALQIWSRKRRRV